MNPSLAHPLFIALKAAFGALAALAVVELFGIRDRLSATFVAVVCVSPTVYTGLRRGLEQIAASALGGVLTWLLTLFLPRAPTLVFGLFGTIYICFRIGFGRAFGVAAFTVLYVLFIPGPSVHLTLEHRLASVAVGVACAIAVNLLVSFATYRSLFARRLKIAHARVGRSFAVLASLLEEGAPAAREAERRALFEDVFPLLRSLFEELGDAVRESRLRGGKTRAQMEASQGATHELLSVAHYGKDLALMLREERGPFPLAAAWARALAAAMEAQQPLTQVTGESEEGPRRALRRATEAYARATLPG